jgi:hypothetical protein
VEVAGGTEDERDPEAPSERDGVLTSAARMPHGWLVLQGSPGSEARSISVRYRGRTQSRRIAGTICGQSFVLDKLAHARLRGFATRFLELRALRPGAETAKAAATNGGW